MLDFFRNLFRNLFGGGAPQAAPAPAPASSQEAHPQSIPDPQPEAQPTVAPGTLQLLLKREASTAADTVGRLYLEGDPVAYTLEGGVPPEESEQAIIPIGTYDVQLRREGGRHATYAFRFGDQHHGLLALADASAPYPVVLCFGHEARYLYGSIIIGETPRDADGEGYRSLSRSESTYLALYTRLSDHLLTGKAVKLTIQSA